MNVEYNSETLKPEITLYIEFVGDHKVGKKSIIETAMDYKFDNVYRNFLREYNFKLDQYSKSNLDYHDKRFKFKTFDSILRLFYHKGTFDSDHHSIDGVVIVFDVTRKETLANLLKNWLIQVKNELGEIPLIIMANKIDLKDQRVIDKDACKIIAKRFKIPVFETSAKFGYNIVGGLKTLAKMIIKSKKIQKNEKLKQFITRYKNLKWLDELRLIQEESDADNIAYIEENEKDKKS
jgi:GTPase SAR1 family protein